MESTLPHGTGEMNISHGHRWGQAVNKTATVYVGREDGPQGRPVAILIDDGDHIYSLALSPEAFTALRAAAVASGCQHHQGVT